MVLLQVIKEVTSAEANKAQPLEGNMRKSARQSDCILPNVWSTGTERGYQVFRWIFSSLNKTVWYIYNEPKVPCKAAVLQIFKLTFQKNFTFLSKLCSKDKIKTIRQQNRVYEQVTGVSSVVGTFTVICENIWATINLLYR